MEEANRQLDDRDTYKILQVDPTAKHQQKVKEFVNSRGKAQNLSEDTINHLTPQEPRTPTFYMLPKIHKTNNPGRPIVASFNSPTERISAFIDRHLQPLVTSLDSHIKDTYDFLGKLKNLAMPLPANALMATIDVTSLYTNIPTTQGLSALAHYLNLRPPNTKPDTPFLVGLSQLVLTMNNFSFMDRHYLQTRGTAMGTRMAPSYANLFMGKVETDFFKTQTLLPLCWFRFIDDIYVIWLHGEESFIIFLQELNTFSSLQFTWEISQHHVNFLDVDIELRDGHLETSVHFKPTNSQQYLHYDSCHPKYTKQALPHSLATRGRRICSNDEDLAKYCHRIANAFVARGYPRQKVLERIHRPSTPRTPANNKIIPLVTQWHPGLQALNGILKRGAHILKASALTNDLALNMPRVYFRRPPNISDHIVRHTPARKTNKPPQSQGSHPCMRPRCKTCEIHPSTSTFTARATGKTYPIRQHNNCTTTNLIYQLQCQLCPAEYIGLTTNSLSTRMNGHRQDTVKKLDLKPVAQHAGTHNRDFNDCYTTRVVKSLPPSCNEEHLRQWELAHQIVTNSRQKPNLNLR